MTPGANLAAMVGASAAGALAAQKLVAKLRSATGDPADAVTLLRRLEVDHGVDSPAVEAFIRVLAKAAR